MTVWQVLIAHAVKVLVLLTLAVIVVTSFGFSRLWTIDERGVPATDTEVRLFASSMEIGRAHV